MGSNFIDYLIADKIVLPSDQQRFYSERIVHLPECYLVNDSLRKIADSTPTRLEVGLPDEGFVFCCFNNNYKIAAPVFDVWMRLLHAVKGSVLWLLADNASAQTNLRKEAAARGIDPARLIFAERLPSEDHLVLDVLVMQRTGQVVMIDDIVPQLRAEDHRDHVLAEKLALLRISRQRLRFSRTSRMPTVIWVGRRSATVIGVTTGSRTVMVGSSAMGHNSNVSR